MNEDAELIQRYLGGEKYAGSLLVARHSSALFCWLKWKTGSREDAEDLTQLVWVRAFPALARLEDRLAVRAWLFAIMRREFTRWLRDHKTSCSLEALGDAIDRLAADALPDVGRVVEDRLTLQNALAQLSEEHRDTFMLRYLSQFTAPEVAQILEVPVGTVESRCYFARQKLRELMLQSEAITGLRADLPTAAVVGTRRENITASAQVAVRKHWFKGNLK